MVLNLESMDLPQKNFWIHMDRTSRRHRRHRDCGNETVARLDRRQGKGQARQLIVKPQALRNSDDGLRG